MLENFAKSGHTASDERSDHSTIWSTVFAAFFKNMGQPRPLFRLFSFFSNKYYNFYIMCKNVKSIQYPVPGFEPTTFGT